eukprot:Opistho-2@12476
MSPKMQSFTATFHIALTLCVLLGALAPTTSDAKEIALLVSAPVEYADGSTNAFFSRVKTGCVKAVLEFFGSAVHNCTFRQETPSVAAVIKYSVAATHMHIFGIGFEWAEHIENVAKNASLSAGVSYSLVDAQPTSPLANVQGILFAEDQGGFMAGFVAGLFTKSNIVGVVAGRPFNALRKFRNGFLNGVHFVCPFCSVLGTYINTFSDTVEAIAATKAQLDQGADVIFPAAGGVSEACALYAAGREAYVIGVDSDFRLTSFRNASDPRTQMLITSSEKRTDVAAYLSLKDKFEGRFAGGTKVIDVSVDGLLLSECSSNRTCAKYVEQITTTETQSQDCTVIRLQSREQRIRAIRAQLASRQLATGVDSAGDLSDIVHPANREWAPLRPYGLPPLPIQGHSVTVTPDNILVVFGGETGDAVVADTYQLDFDNLDWTRVKPPTAPPARVSHTAVLYAGRVIVYGGLSPNKTTLDDTWSYNTGDRTWTVVNTTATPRGRALHAAVVSGSEMFVYGGSSSLTVLSELWSLNLATLVWRQYGPLSSVRPPALLGAVLLAPASNTLYLFGGQQTTVATNKLYAFDIETRVWQILTPSAGPSPPRVWHHAGIVLDARRLLFVGGIADDTIVPTVSLYNIPRNEWIVGESSDIPKPTHSHALVMFNQSAKATACRFAADPTITVCTPQQRPILAVLGGVDTNGITNAMFVTLVISESVAGIDVVPPSSDDLGLKVALPVVLSACLVAM